MPYIAACVDVSRTVFRDRSQSNHGTAGNREVGGFVNSTVALLGSCLHVTSKRSKVLLTKMVALTLSVKEALTNINCILQLFSKSSL